MSTTTDSVGPAASRSVLHRVGGVLVRAARRARKQAARRLKGLGEVSRQARRTQKDLYFWARQNRGGQLLLETAAWMRAPNDRLQRRRAAAAYISSSRLRGGLDPSGGFEIVSFDRMPEFAPVLADQEPPAWIYLHGLKSPLSSTALRAQRAGKARG